MTRRCEEAIFVPLDDVVPLPLRYHHYFRDDGRGGAAADPFVGGGGMCLDEVGRERQARARRTTMTRMARNGRIVPHTESSLTGCWMLNPEGTLFSH